MRNGYKLNAPLAVTLFASLLSGCAADPGRSDPLRAQAALSAGFAALDAQQYNEAIARADEFLASTPHGPGSAEALYLKGRALEATPAADAREAKQHLQEARAAYIAALERLPDQPLEAYIRTSLANVAYFQDDYPTAISQWSAAYDHLDREDIRSWALYRTGVAQQRLNQFEQADQTFDKVMQVHPGTVPASRARERRGMRNFYVQLATFPGNNVAEKAAADLRKQGVATSRLSDGKGHTLLRIGPVASYQQAQYFKDRFAAQYPDAVVIP